MTVLRAAERRAAEAIGALTVTNPFEPERLALERKILGARFVEHRSTWSFDPNHDVERPNVAALDARAEQLVQKFLVAFGEGVVLSDAERSLYADLSLYLTFSTFEDAFFCAIEAGTPPTFYDRFAQHIDAAFGRLGFECPEESAHLFALFYQLRRAFHFTYRRILGASRPAAGLRAAVWQSIFTHDFRRYRSGLFERMQDIPTLVIGPTGTGKELVASAIGWSRYIPYDASKGRFEADPMDLFVPLNLSALSPTLIESELFGHQKGAFTSAEVEREGYLDRPSRWVTIFLDEIGDVDAAIQVKLLRVLETRRFNRLGDNASRTFGGKIVAATHRDLAADKAADRFREDFYYRLCADRIETPSLSAQIRDDPAELERIVRALASRFGTSSLVESLTADTMTAIADGVPTRYAWPGNIRELEQCVKNVLVRKQYRPERAGRASTDIFGSLDDGVLTADEALSRYVSLVYVQSGSYEEAARRLLMDRRTVKRRVDPEWVDRLSSP